MLMMKKGGFFLQSFNLLVPLRHNGLCVYEVSRRRTELQFTEFSIRKLLEK